jgi:hypothetical protein
MTYTRFELEGDTGKTKVWRVYNCNDGSRLGRISWHGPWRKYCFWPEGHTIWSPDCLHDVAKFMEDQMKLRRAERNKKADPGRSR